MKESKTEPTADNPDKDWQKTQYANLIRYVPSGTYYARIRVAGKLIRKSLKTNVLSVAKLRLSDFEKQELNRAEAGASATQGRMSVKTAIEIHLQRVAGDHSLKPRTKEYHQQRINALLKSWPGLETREIRSITKPECLAWAARYGEKSSPTTFNHAIGMLRAVLDIGIEMGARYDNPAKAIKRAREVPKKLTLPEPEQFESFVQSIETAGSRDSQNCADLVRFLAFGGFRKTEAAFITWADCHFTRGKIAVNGDPETGTKNSERREVPMIPDMRALLERLRSERPDAAPSEPVMRVRECQKAMDRAARLVGIKRITHHDLRHLFATRCIESGVDIPTVSRWLGHRDGGMLAVKIYGHLRDQHSTEMAQRVTFSKPVPENVVPMLKEGAA